MRSFVFSFVCLMSLGIMAQAATVSVQVEKIKEPRGKIFWALHGDKKNFLKDGVEPVLGGIVEVDKKDFSFEIQNVPEGEYALVVFQDLDGNGELNTTLFSYPLEPFGFSKNPRIWFGPPSFEKSSFVVGGEDADPLTIELK